MMRTFGLIGKTLDHSFSQQFFTKKFENEAINDAVYKLFPLNEIEDLTSLLVEQEGLIGLNVTIPYKEAVIPFLDKIDPIANQIGAVNTILIKEGEKIGYNTDIAGFAVSLLKKIVESGFNGKRALILGTGGASKAVAFSLAKLGIPFRFVSRASSSDMFTYDDLDDAILKDYNLIVNTTPLGTHPNLDECPNLPYQFLTNEHLLYDLVYNPEQSLFLKKGEAAGSITTNGYAMLVGQALESWKIWNE